MCRTSLVLFLYVLLSGTPACGDDNPAAGDAGPDSAGQDAGPGADGVVDADPGADASGDCDDPDGDGYGLGPDCLGPDCAPGDPELHPGAVEWCDGRDNDCNDQIDELTECGLPRIWVFLLAGQSNMVGLGYNTDLSGVDLTPVANTTIYYNSTVHPNTNALQWLPLAPGFGVSEGTFGLELGFGRRLQDHWPGRPVALIKVAEGGTALHDRWDAPTGDLYQLLLSEVAAQLAVLSQSYRPQVVGFLWMQGESDAIEVSHANAYHANLTEFMTSLRQAVGVEYVPLTAGLIAVQSLWPYAGTVRGATQAVSQELGQMEVIETTDLTRHAADPAHYDTQGNLTLGHRFAETLVALLPLQHSFQGGFREAQGDGFWLYRDRQGASVSPMILDPTDEQWWVGTEPFQLIGPGWMHPGATRDAELVWWVPHDGLVEIQMDVTDTDPAGGDGVWVSFARDEVVLWGPVAIPNGGSTQHSLQLVVQQGQQLQFRTSAGPANDEANDTTAWNLNITVLDIDP